MKVLLLILFLAVATVHLDAFVRPPSSIRTPSGRPASGGRKDSSVKGGVQQQQQQEEEEEQEPAAPTTLPPESADECASHDEEDKQVADSFKKLMLHGDNEILLSEHDEHQEEQCNEAKGYLQSFVKHVKCIKGEFGRQMSSLADGFTKWVDKRCNSKEWHDKFIKVSDCLAKQKTLDDWNACDDKNIALYSSILKNVPKEKQLYAMCCFVTANEDCQYNATESYCGAEVGDTAVELTRDPWNERTDAWCRRKYDCRKYPKIRRQLNKVWYGKVPAATREEYYKLLYKVLKNSFSSENDEDESL